jgi:hypothetical protein
MTGAVAQPVWNPTDAVGGLFIPNLRGVEEQERNPTDAVGGIQNYSFVKSEVG